MPKIEVSEDFRFLIACSQSELSTADKEFIQKTIQHSTFNIQHLIPIASRHGVLPLVYKTLKNLDSDYPSPIITHEILPLLKQHYLILAQRNMQMSGELIRVMRLLKENDIEALSFKGPILAQQVYGDITLRQYSDLDILIHSEEREHAAAILAKKGYETLLSMSPTQEQTWYENAKEMIFYQPGKNLYIDLQWQFFDNDYPLRFRQETIWETACETSLNGNNIKTFSSDSLLIYLCVHGSKHLWERIGWIKDIDLLVRSGHLNWEEVGRRIEGSGFERMFLLGLYLANDYFKTPLPDAVKERINRQTWLKALNRFIVDNWSTKKSMFRNSAAMLHLFPTSGSKVKYLTKVILKPAKNEYRYIDLPSGLHWAYYLIRPYLLLRKYLVRGEFSR